MGGGLTKVLTYHTFDSRAWNRNLPLNSPDAAKQPTFAKISELLTVSPHFFYAVTYNPLTATKHIPHKTQFYFLSMSCTAVGPQPHLLLPWDFHETFMVAPFHGHFHADFHGTSV